MSTKRGNEYNAVRQAIRRAAESVIPDVVLRVVDKAYARHNEKEFLECLDYWLEVERYNLAKRRSEHSSPPPYKSEADMFRAELECGDRDVYGHSILWLAKKEALLVELRAVFLDFVRFRDEVEELKKQHKNDAATQKQLLEYQALRRVTALAKEVTKMDGRESSVWSWTDREEDLPFGTTEAAARRARLENDYLMSPADRLERVFLAPSSAPVPASVPATASDLAAFICLYPNLPIFTEVYPNLDGTLAAQVWIGAHNFVWNDVSMSVRNANVWNVR
jgi:hypothetical protein